MDTCPGGGNVQAHFWEKFATGKYKGDFFWDMCGHFSGGEKWLNSCTVTSLNTQYGLTSVTDPGLF